MTPSMHPTAATTRFSEAIRAASWSLHQNAEGSHFMRDLLAGNIEEVRYAQLVAQLYCVYAVLEEVAAAMRGHPLARPFVRDELMRLPALEADLRFYFGPDWSAQVSPTASTRTYCERLRQTCAEWAGGFVAHHYTRYMGDLSGGQMIGRAVERAYDLHDHEGARFYVFDRIPDLTAFKNEYRALLDGATWDADEQERIIHEVLQAYQLNTRLLAAL